MDNMNYSITLPVSNKTISWKNYEGLSRVYKLQTGPQHWAGINTSELFFARVKAQVEWNWARVSKYIDINNLKKVIDVGSGLGLFDLTLHHLNNDTEFYLVDKSIINIPVNIKYYSYEDYPFYHSWNVVTDCLTSSNIDKTKFTFLSPEDVWPNNVDLVISMHSWCWHYPKEYYWGRLLNSLKIGGTLVLDVLNIKDKNIVEEISDQLGATPTYDLRYAPANHPFANEFTLINKSHGGCYSWVRVR